MLMIDAEQHFAHPVIDDLCRLIHQHQWEARFEQAFAAVRRYQIAGFPDLCSLNDYFSWLVGLLEWTPCENSQGREIYNRICEFYFVLDQPSLRELQSPQTPCVPAPPLTPLSGWMVDFARAWGSFLDMPASLTAQSLQSFYQSPAYNMGEYITDPGGWKSFNQFFARHVKPGYRPVAAPLDDQVLVSPADSTFVGAWAISADSHITVKSLRWSLDELLADSPFRDRFRSGIFMHSFLNTTDYHRLHTPVSGRVLESRVIHGQVYLDVIAKPTSDDDDAHQLTREPVLHAQDGTGYQFSQARGLLVLESSIGLVAVLPVGMCQVSSVVMTADVGVKLRKGEEFAYFQFGGSDVVMLFEASANVSLIMQPGVHYKQGNWIGQSFPV